MAPVTLSSLSDDALKIVFEKVLEGGSCSGILPLTTVCKRWKCMPRAVTILDIVHVPEESINHFFVFLQKLCREPGSKGIRQIRINNGPGGKRFSWKDKKTDSSLFVSFFGRVVISSNRLAEQGIMLLDADTCSLSVVQQQRLVR